MLVLQRKKGQTLVIGDNIKVTVVEATSDGVRLAIDAPKDIRILREELVEAVMVNKQSVADKDQIQKMKTMLKQVGITQNEEN